MTDTLSVHHARLERARAAATITTAAQAVLADYLAEVRDALDLPDALTAAADDQTPDVPPDLDSWPDDTFWQTLVALVLLPAAIAAYTAAFRNRTGYDPGASVLAVFTAAATDSLYAAQIPAEVYAAARTVLINGRENGQSPAELRAALAGRLQSENQMWLATRIGTTEGVAAANHAALDAAQAWANASGEQVWLGWLATSDSEVRAAHWSTNHQTIELGGWFSVGGEQARYPGDYNLSAAMRCNCRCCLIQLSDTDVEAWRNPTGPSPSLPATVE